MKRKKLLYICNKVFLALFSLLCMSSCIKDDLGAGGVCSDVNFVNINVMMPTPVVTTPMTRASVSDFDRMDDLNVVISSGSDILHTVYFRFADLTNGGEIDGMNVYYHDAVTQNGLLRQFQLTFTKEWLSEKNIPSATCQFYLVANWGAQIPDEIKTVEALKALKAGSQTNQGLDGWVKTPNVMFGTTIRETVGTHTHPVTKVTDDCRQMEMELKRTAAMITLKIDGSGLGEGIVITPTKVSLHNVPKECTIGNQNIVTTELGDTEVLTGAVSPDGEYKDGNVWGGNVSLVGETTQSMPNFSDNTRFKTSIGEHYGTNVEVGDATIDNPSATTVQPLFLYENMHGEKFGNINNQEQQWKRPATVENEDIKAIEDHTKSCSYLMVTADYYKYNATDGSLESSGTVSWRFFLGKDVTQNFDVERNNYYKIDLTLSESAIGELESTWRVNGEVSDLAIVGDDDIVLGGGGEMFCVTFLAADAKKNLHVSYSGYSGFIYVESEKKAGTWISLTDGSSLTPGVIKIDQNETTGLFEVWFYVQPMIRDVTWFEENNHKRNGAITFQPSGSSSVSLSVTQYEPIRIDITADDVSDPNDKDMQEIKNLITTYYNYDFNNENPFTIYLDRIDRDPMPWGFDGQEIDHNQTSGFENVYHLIDKNATGPVCVRHREYAKRYLPTGKSYHNISSADLDYTRGSCMMHAAFMNDFQKYYDENTLNGVKTEDLVQTVNLPDRPTNSSVDGLTFQWCVPSIVGWQLLEKLDRYFKNEGKGGIFDPDYPIIPFYSYWTSNAGATNLPEDVYPDADGKTNSFVYEFGVGLDAITEEHPYGAQYLRNRSLPLRYRLINIDPGLPKDGGGEPDPME